MNLDDEEDLPEGVKAIIFLQKMVGVDEPVERAKRNWASFRDWEKESTLRMYRLMKGGDSDAS